MIPAARKKTFARFQAGFLSSDDFHRVSIYCKRFAQSAGPLFNFRVPFKIIFCSFRFTLEFVRSWDHSQGMPKTRLPLFEVIILESCWRLF